MKTIVFNITVAEHEAMVKLDAKCKASGMYNDDMWMRGLEDILGKHVVAKLKGLQGKVGGMDTKVHPGDKLKGVPRFGVGKALKGRGAGKRKRQGRLIKLYKRKLAKAGKLKANVVDGELVVSSSNGEAKGKGDDVGGDGGVGDG